MDGKLGEKSELETLFTESMEEFKLHEEAWAENRRLALDDIEFRAGKQWPQISLQPQTKVGSAGGIA